MNVRTNTFIVIVFVVGAFLRIDGAAAIAESASGGALTHIERAEIKPFRDGIVISIRGNGSISKYTAFLQKDLRQWVLEIPTHSKNCSPLVFPIKGPLMESTTVHHFSEKIRIENRFEQSIPPMFSSQTQADGLLLFFFPAASPRSASIPVDVSASVNIEESVKGTLQDRLQNCLPQRLLLEPISRDGKPENELFAECLEAYRRAEWQVCLAILDRLISSSPSTSINEKAYFLKAQVHEKLYRENGGGGSGQKLIRYYEEAINRFPESAYIPYARLSIGNRLLEMGYDVEAIAYYNLILKKDRDTVIAGNASVKKAGILSAKQRFEEALSLLSKVRSAFSNRCDVTEVTLEMAKVNYQMHRFRQSLEFLLGLAERSTITCRFPEVQLYIGYNYRQMGEHGKAIENLLSYYNIAPEGEGNDLVLARIGDAFRDDGHFQKAAKLYRLVIERYPMSEGATIGKIRLAEQMEAKEAQSTGPALIGDVADSPEDLYAAIGDDTSEAARVDSPLSHVAKLKLAVLHQNEGRYWRSLSLLKEMIQDRSTVSLEKEILFALKKTMIAWMSSAVQRKENIQVVNFYEKEKKMVGSINAPELFLLAADAYLGIGLEEMAVDAYRKADSMMNEEERPADMLFLLGKDSMRSGDTKTAFRLLEKLISRHATSPLAAKAEALLGDFHFSAGHYPQAQNRYAEALSHAISACDQLRLRIALAAAAINNGQKEIAIETLHGIDPIRYDCENGEEFNRKMGDLYFSMGLFQEAAFRFSAVAAKSEDTEGKLPVLYKMGQCQLRMDKEDDALAVFHQIAKSEDPFWSRLAREEIGEIELKSAINQQLNG